MTWWKAAKAAPLLGTPWHWKYPSTTLASHLPCSAAGACIRRRSSALMACSLARIRSRRERRRTWKRPLRVRPQMWVKPRKSKVSGLPSPPALRLAAAKRPNSISRVLSGWSARAIPPCAFRDSSAVNLVSFSALAACRTRSSPGTRPRDTPEGHARGTRPRDTPGGHAPGDTPRGHAPGDTPRGTRPGGHAPGDRPARLGVRYVSAWPAFRSAPSPCSGQGQALRSPGSAPGCPALFAGFLATAPAPAQAGGGVRLLRSVHRRRQPLRPSRRRPARRPAARSPRFRRDPFLRDVVFDHGRATAPRIAVPHVLPSTLLTASAAATFELSRLHSTPHTIAVYASQPPSPTTNQQSLAGARYGLPAPVFHRLDHASFPGAQAISAYRDSPARDCFVANKERVGWRRQVILTRISHTG
jgi:hypothetical protein